MRLRRFSVFFFFCSSSYLDARESVGVLLGAARWSTCYSSGPPPAAANSFLKGPERHHDYTQRKPRQNKILLTTSLKTAARVRTKNSAGEVAQQGGHSSLLNILLLVEGRGRSGARRSPWYYCFSCCGKNRVGHLILKTDTS